MWMWLQQQVWMSLLLPVSGQSLSSHWQLLLWLCWYWWSGLGWHREVVGECPAARFGSCCALFVAWCSRLPWLAAACSGGSGCPDQGGAPVAQTLSMAWERAGATLTSRLGSCGVERIPSQGWTGVKGAACPAGGCMGCCLPLHNCYTKEGAVLGPTVP